MSEFNPEQFEAELKRLRPAQPPAEVLNRISTEVTSRATPPSQSRPPRRLSWNWTGLLRWAVPFGALAVVCVALYLKHQVTSLAQPQTHRLASSDRSVLKADKVEIDRQWVADFDAVAKLPSGEPVRFRCEQWMDKVQWRDSRKGLAVEQTTPRLEIVPIRFETY